MHPKVLQALIWNLQKISYMFKNQSRQMVKVVFNGNLLEKQRIEEASVHWKEIFFLGVTSVGLVRCPAIH